MSLFRAGGITVLVLAVLATAGLTALGGWYTANTMGETFGHLLMWFPISLFIAAPVGLILFPLLYTMLGIAGRPSGKLFAVTGGVIGAVIAGYAMFRFRTHLAISPGIMFVALPLLVFGATLLGVLGGFMFERMARHAAQPIPPFLDPDADEPSRSDDRKPPA